jgi:hypothetical protein
MAWARFESKFPEHVKVYRAGASLGRAGTGRVIAMMTAMTCFSVDQLTDGFLPDEKVRTSPHDRRPLEVAAALVAAELWHRVDGGYQIHDFHDFNPAAEAVKAKRQADLARKGFRADSTRNRNGFHAEKNGSESDPDPEDPDLKTDRDHRDAVFARFWQAYPRKVSKVSARKAFEKLKPDNTLATVILLAVEQQARSPQWRRDGGQFIPHPATWLNQRRWEDEGPTPPTSQTTASDWFEDCKRLHGGACSDRMRHELKVSP